MRWNNGWQMFVIGAIAVLGGVARAETPATNYFNYYVSNYPAPTGVTCDAFAKSVGDRLHAVTGVTIWSTDCENQTQDQTILYSIKVVYEAAQELHKVTTLPADTLSESPGIYDDLDDCNQDLASQLAKFRSLTGLQEVVAYCSPQPFYGWTYPVALVIESFGTAKLTPFQFEDLLSGVDDNAMPTILQELSTKAAGQNIQLYSAIIGDDESQLQQIRLGYYAANQLPIYLFQQMEYPSSDDCAAQLADVRHGFALADASPLAVFCEGGKERGTLGAVLNDPGLVIDQAPQPYANMDACNADRDRVLKTYKAQNLDARYILCQGHDANEFYMYVLERKKSH